MRRYLSSSFLFTFALPLWSVAATPVSLPGRAIVPVTLPAMPLIAPVVLPGLPQLPAGPAILPGKPLQFPIKLPTNLPSPVSRPIPMQVAIAHASAAGEIKPLFDWSHLDLDGGHTGLEDAGDLVPVSPKPGPLPPARAAAELVIRAEKEGGIERLDSGKLFDGAAKRESLSVRVLSPSTL